MSEKIIKQNGVIWIDKTGFSVYLENKPFIRLNFTPDLFNNLEIMNKVKLENSILTFIKQANLTNLTFVLILAPDILFEKDWPIIQTEIQKKEETDFIDSIPFENTINQSWIKDNKKKLVATNQDYIYFLRDIFSKENGQLIGAYPYSLFGANVRNESVKEIWKSLNSLKQNNLIDTSSPQTSAVNPINITESKKTTKSSSLPLLIGVFTVLIGLLVFMMLRK